ncbi:MAG: hypothetical protein ACLFPV_10925 [Spirochaetaceae bacterium]
MDKAQGTLSSKIDHPLHYFVQSRELLESCQSPTIRGMLPSFRFYRYGSTRSAVYLPPLRGTTETNIRRWCRC